VPAGQAPVPADQRARRYQPTHPHRPGEQPTRAASTARSAQLPHGQLVAPALAQLGLVSGGLSLGHYRQGL
jgi:hypothetical protein